MPKPAEQDDQELKPRHAPDQPGGGASAVDDSALRSAAGAYWRLWRRNWRAPFPPEDAPPGLWADASRHRGGAS